MPTELTTDVFSVRLSGDTLHKFVAYCDANALRPSEALREFLDTGLAMGTAPAGRRTAAEIRRVMLALAKRIGDVGLEIGERTQWQPDEMLAEVARIGAKPPPRRTG